MLLAAVLAAAPVLAMAQMAPVNTVPSKVLAGTYQVEPAHTRILFAVSHMGFTTWYGEFTHASGTLVLDPAHVAETKLSITIPADTVTTTNTKLDGELNSPEWFDTAKYPTITFVSTKVTRTGHDTAKVTGDLTFHGVTLPETLDVTFNASGVNFLTHQYTVGFNATGDLLRSKFGQSTYVPVIGDKVDLTISAAFVK
jgi:polyisoprenoid-binding protein YceI